VPRLSVALRAEEPFGVREAGEIVQVESGTSLSAQLRATAALKPPSGVTVSV
jgi:hypothetical protein